jgi:NAD(P)-dependent dehydrogenase (short-subunit alcohol dehydrogenase family)
MAETEGRPPQHQDHQPGTRGEMTPPPSDSAQSYKGNGKLEGKVAFITGGDSGIGRSTAISFAKEGADLCIVYLDENADAEDTKGQIEAAGGRALLMRGDIRDAGFCREAVEAAAKKFGAIDIVINNAAVQYPEEDILAIKLDNLKKTFETNIFAMFYVIQAALPHMRDGASIINTASITAFAGHPLLLDYSATKGAIVAFTRSLALSLVKKGIRVNAVAPGPVWTPLIPASFDAQQVAEFGSDNPMGRAATADEVSPAFVFLAADDARFVTGQILHVNGGEHLG